MAFKYDSGLTPIENEQYRLWYEYREFLKRDDYQERRQKYYGFQIVKIGRVVYSESIPIKKVCG